MIVVKENDYLVKHRAEVGQFFGQAPADAYIELREPSTFDASRLQIVSKQAQDEGGEGPIITFMAELLPRIIVDHSLYKTETKKLEKEEVAKLILDKTELFAFIVDEYSRNVLFTLGKGSASKS
jgi:hypothetical protein